MIDGRLFIEALANHSIPRGMGRIRVFLIDLVRIVSGRQRTMSVIQMASGEAQIKIEQIF